MIGEQFNIAKCVIEAAETIDAQDSKFVGYATGGGCDYIARYINPDKDRAEFKEQFLPAAVMVFGSALDAGTPDDLAEASRVTLYLDDNDWSGPSIAFDFPNAIMALQWMKDFDLAHYERGQSDTAGELAEALERERKLRVALDEAQSKAGEYLVAGDLVRKDNDKLRIELVRLRPFMVGDLVRFKRQVDRFPHFSVPVGATGVLVEYTRGSLIGEAEHKVGGCAHVRVHATLSGGEEWDNCVEWIDDMETFEDFALDVELWKHEPSRICDCPRCGGVRAQDLTRTEFVYVRCEGDGSWLRRFADNGSAIFTLNKSEAVMWKKHNPILKNLIDGGVYYFADDKGNKIN